MIPTPSPVVTDALACWNAGVRAVLPETLLGGRIRPFFESDLAKADRILVMGGGKAGAAMAKAFEKIFPEFFHKLTGIVNVPNDTVKRLKKIRLHGARPAGSNFPTADGVFGCEKMMMLAQSAQPNDVGVCFISGGGSALMPLPVPGVTLADKLEMTKLLHHCGATINEMNTVRKHLSQIKGGGLARAWNGGRLFSLILSDVVGDPLDVIASGPTESDPSTFAEALGVLEKYRIVSKAPPSVLAHLKAAKNETLKKRPKCIHNHILGNNRTALDAVKVQAKSQGYRVYDLGSDIEGDTRQAGVLFAKMIHSFHKNGNCKTLIMMGGETTVQLGKHPGKGGRNQEFVLTVFETLKAMDRIPNLAVVSGGTDGEDGPTDAAGAWIDTDTWAKAQNLELDSATALANHNAYPFFEKLDQLIITGATNTNVMDIRLAIIG